MPEGLELVHAHMPHGYAEPVPGFTEYKGAHTDEQRALIASGELKPGDPALDVPVTSMSDRELTEETVVLLRSTRDTVLGFVTDVEASPLGKMLKSGSSPFGALFGR